MLTNRHFVALTYAACVSVIAVSLAGLSQLQPLAGSGNPRPARVVREALVWVLSILSVLTGMAHVLGAAVLGVGAALGVLLRVRTTASLLGLAPVIGWVLLAHAATDPPPHLPWANQIL